MGYQFRLLNSATNACFVQVAFCLLIATQLLQRDSKAWLGLVAAGQDYLAQCERLHTFLSLDGNDAIFVPVICIFEVLQTVLVDHAPANNVSTCQR